MSTHNFIAAIKNIWLRVFRWILKYTSYGILTIINSGSKTKIPVIKNDLLLEPAVQLATKIRRGELSSETLVRAYIERIIEVNDFINAVADSRYAEALEEARQVDQLVQSGTLSEKQMAEDLPFLGIPFTAKEMLPIKGLSKTGGLVSRRERIAEKDCECVQMMKSCGAIPVAVSIIPELCFWWESYNNVHGRTRNPYDTRRTPGGSSGGEAALLGAAASVIGIGSDIACSIRLPAFFTGVFGHKPTHGVVPLGGEYPPISKELRKYFSSGPMTRYAVDLKYLLSALVGKETTQKLKLLDPVDVKSIKVFYMIDNPVEPITSPCADIKNGIKKVVNILSNDGFVVEKANLKYLRKGFEIWCAHLMNIKDEKMTQLMQEGKTEEKYFALKETIRLMVGKSDHTLSAIMVALSQDVLAPLIPNMSAFYKKRGEKMKQELVDLLEPEPAVFLYPTYPEVAPYCGGTLSHSYDIGYAMLFSVAALPVTQCPLGLDSSGLPFGMQIVSAQNNDRLSIALAEYIEEKIGGWVPPS